ncbi:ABC transporter substrate-binding protein [Halomarina litorea]|uniref:ABC transporter substrate-binding protein n=1 Tax=Halomarina litorea TaxID=2961595 RepID=UPI0020C28267|nr:ABC transporter substrate-binding protein [Halomarina sp. BCD28]
MVNNDHESSEHDEFGDLDGDWSVTRRHALALASASAAGLAGCLGGGGGNDSGGGGNGDGNGSGGGPGGAAVHVITDYNNEAWQQKWEESLVPAFQEETDWKVEMEYSGFSGNQESRLANLIQAGDPPAINSSTFEQVGDIWASGGLRDIGDAVAAAQENSGTLISQPYHNGESYWEMPHGAYTGTFIYRQDVYDELGLSVPTSFQGVLENAKAIDEADMGIRGYGLAGQKTGKAQDEFQTYLANMGVQELRFKDRTKQEEVEVWFPEEEIVTLLQYFKDLSQYSPDPTGIGWGSSLRNWVGGQFAQQYHLNIWPAGVAAGANDEVAKNTAVAPMPLWEEGGITKEDSYLSNPTPDGHHVFSNSDNPEGGAAFLRWLYAEDGERAARMYETEPTRFLPIYSDIIETDTFTGYDYWQQYPRQLKMLEKVQNEIVAEYYDNIEGASVLANSPIGVYYYRFFFQAEMVNQVVTDTLSPQKAYEQGLQRANEIVGEARERMSDRLDN